MSASVIHSAACMQTVLVACLLLSFVHGLHALPLEVQAAAAEATGEHSKQLGARSAPKSVSRSTPHTPQHTPIDIPTTERVSLIESEDVQWPVEPFVVDGAVVTGVADPEDQAALRLSLAAEADASVSMQLEGWWPRDRSDASADRGASRRLLHGHRKPWKYTTCNRCTIVRCNARACSGHCRKNRRLFICSSPRFFAAPCVPRVPEDLSLLPVDPLDAGVSVVVTAPAPYIGCVEIANKPTGCPERFTRGTTADGRSVDVLESTCMSERYLPDCSSPLFPFGICECRVRVTGSGTETRACDITELSAGLPLGRTPSPSRTSGDLVVELRGDMTYTEFVDYIEEDQSPNHVYSRSVAVDGGDVNVRLEIFRQDTVNVAPGPASGDSYVREESDFGEEYNDYLQSTLPSDYLPVQPPPPVGPDYDYVQRTPTPSAGDPDPSSYYGDPEPYYGDAGY